MRMKTGTVVVTDGPGTPWRGRFQSRSLETSDDGIPVWHVLLTDAWPDDRERDDVLYPRVEVLCWAVVEAVRQEVG